jgi:alpha/beta superfamily hydrolase
VIGHVIISHGLQSSPESGKAIALSMVAERLGWTHQRPDFSDLDAQGELGDVPARIERLSQLANAVRGPLVLAGSSMGAFISARVSLDVPVAGLFLMAPPTALRGHSIAMEGARVPTRIIHGWHDELIPASAVVQWAQARSDHLVLVDDSHRLAAHVDLCAAEFASFLQGLS